MLKTTIGQAAVASKMYGTYREGIFYDKMSKSIGVRLPTIYYSYGSIETGAKVVLMEDLSHLVGAGVFFGDHYPGNKDKDWQALKKDTNIEANDVIRNVFLYAAKIHATYWKKESLLDQDWIARKDWLQGKGQ